MNFRAYLYILSTLVTLLAASVSASAETSTEPTENPAPTATTGTIPTTESTTTPETEPTENPRKKVFQGFDGGMMVHTGYLKGTIAPLAYTAKGAPFGIGGVIRIHLGEHWRLGTEGYFSSLNQLHNGSYVKYGWGGLLTDFYWKFKWVMPYAGITIGGGSNTDHLMFEGADTEWGEVKHSVWHKQKFAAIDPFLGCDIIVSNAFHVTAKADWLNCLGHGSKNIPTGPRFYLGFIFFH